MKIFVSSLSTKEFHFLANVGTKLRCMLLRSTKRGAYYLQDSRFKKLDSHLEIASCVSDYTCSVFSKPSYLVPEFAEAIRGPFILLF